MENHGSLVPLARHCPLADDPSVSVAPNMMEVILVATRHLFTAMEIYGSSVLLARHCPNIENRCFSRQVWWRGRDLNPRQGFWPCDGLANRCLRPLGHLSTAPSRGIRGYVS